MTSPRDFLAAPGKRKAAALFDAFAVLLLFLLVGAVGEANGHDLGSLRVFLLTALAYHAACLVVMDGQTCGKRAQGICVIASAGHPVGPGRALVRACTRYLPPLLLTVHYAEWDLVEGTAAFIVRAGNALLVAGEFALLQRPPARQTLADRLAGTLVVNTPEIQAHRAPAVPMYSATDAEFGPPPRRPGSARLVRMDDGARPALR